MSQSTVQQRANWSAFECKEVELKRVAFGPDQILVAPPTAEAWKALASVLAFHKYQIRPVDTSSYCCRAITGGTGRSLHSFGIALDINANTNPYKKTPSNPPVRFSNKPTQDQREHDVRLDLADTDMTEAMIVDVRALKTKAGTAVFEWGGDWHSVKDTMHFELDVSPAELASGIDWSSVAGANGAEPPNVALLQQAPRPLPMVTATAGELGRFEKCYPIVEKWEGNFDNDPDDPGGPTNMGITQGDLTRWRQRPASVDDVRTLTRDEARQIFRALYWTPIQGDQLPLPTAQMCYDSAVLTGVHQAGRDLQNALNRQNAALDADGNIGPRTVAACLRANQKQLVSGFAEMAEDYLRTRPGFPKYGKGWLNRLNEVHGVAAAMADAPVAPPSRTEASTIIGVSKMPSTNIDDLLRKVADILRTVQDQAPQVSLPSSSSAQPADLEKVKSIINILLGADSKAAPPLGQVNGALGETIGNLLDGKKSAIGIIGALITGILGAPSNGIAEKLLALVPGAAGMSGVAMPIFLALSAWGVLGKLEKWRPAK